MLRDAYTKTGGASDNIFESDQKQEVCTAVDHPVDPKNVDGKLGHVGPAECNGPQS